jgi:PKD repeat protein
MCLGTALTFTNATTPTGIVEHRMYNYNNMLAHFGVASSDSTYAWDMGDGSALQWSKNAAYTYPAAGTDTITLFTLGGLWKSCVDFKQTYVTITPNAAASFTYDASASPLVTFTSTSTNASTYSWDFGDASPLDNTANPSHTYAGPGTYNVTLTVTSAGGCNTDFITQSVTVVATGISTLNASNLSIYPNPSTGLFTLNMGTTTKTHVEIYNMVGELISAQEFTAQTANIDLSNVKAGVYSVKISANNSNVVKQVVITK